MHKVCPSNADTGFKKGVVFVLKNINHDINIDNINRLHPFYLVYIDTDGGIVSNHLNVKHTLDMMRAMAKGKSEPIREAYQLFNTETDDGKDMSAYTALLNASIRSIMETNDERDVDSLFRPGGTTGLVNAVKGLKDFELITFFVIV
jgi:hypothetical protein